MFRRSLVLLDDAGSVLTTGVFCRVFLFDVSLQEYILMTYRSFLACIVVCATCQVHVAMQKLATAEVFPPQLTVLFLSFPLHRTQLTGGAKVGWQKGEALHRPYAFWCLCAPRRVAVFAPGSPPLFAPPLFALTGRLGAPLGALRQSAFL